MKILLVNQTFYPDVASTAQHAGDLAAQLVASGHELTVVSSRRAYDNPQRIFPANEVWKGVRIRRIGSLGLGKTAKWRRALDFASFLIRCTVQLALLPKFDVVIAMTSPPLVAFIASLFSSWKGGRLVYWVMDLNPDEALAAGWLRENSMAARVLQRISNYTFRRSARVIVLDRFMKARVLEKGVDAAVIDTIPPWSHDDAVQNDVGGREKFRREHGLEDKFVVMYSGNHSPCHPLESLVDAAQRLADRKSIAFCFIGGGSEHAKVRALAEARGLGNVLCLPYQPIDRLSASLNSADMHAVVMGNPFVGIVHPCKIYNVLRLGKPVLYIGPREGHIPDMVRSVLPCEWYYPAAHGEVDLIVEHILAASTRPPGDGADQKRIAADFSAHALLPQLAARIEFAGADSVATVKPRSAMEPTAFL
ncbi:MAG: glycosyltransferase family 4 protein [Acidobacteriota bacterium]|nr:glycosyltransferase family 4 protein [Acidobacteriota bacterium]